MSSGDVRSCIYYVGYDQDRVLGECVRLSVVYRDLHRTGYAVWSGVLMEGMTRVVAAQWEIFHMSAQEEAAHKKEMMERTIMITVREFLASVDYRAVSFNVDLRYSETDRHAEITAFATETRKVRFEKSG